MTWSLLTAGFGLVLVACSGDSAQPIEQADAMPEAAGDVVTLDDSGDDGSTPDVSTTLPDAGVDGPSAADLVAFCDQIYGAVTNAFEACCNAADKGTTLYQFVDGVLHLEVTDCEQKFGASATNGRITYDPSSAQACESELQTYLGQIKCPILNDSNQSAGSAFAQPPCSNALTGLQAIGSPCAQDYECQTGLTCIGWTDSSDGTCQAPPSSGSPCGPAASDAGTLNLDFGFAGHPKCVSGDYCSAGACAALQVNGGSCYENEQCQAPLTCYLEQCGAGSASAQNGACKQKQDCQDGLYCALGDGGGAGTCQSREAAGSTCEGGLSSTQCDGICEVSDASAVGQCVVFCGSN
jgi:hypothetical protein